MRRVLPPLGLILLGALLLYGLGRWDQALDERARAHQARVDRVLAAGAAYRARQDSLRQAERGALEAARALAGQARVAEARIRRLEGDRRADSAAVAAAAVDSLAGLLGLTVGPVGRWGTDTAGVRRLAQLRIRALRGDSAIPALEDLVALERERADSLERAVLTAGIRADSAEARVVVLEGLLEERRRLGRCRIVGLLPCPSRTTTLVLGIGVGLAAGLGF